MVRRRMLGHARCISVWVRFSLALAPGVLACGQASEPGQAAPPPVLDWRVEDPTSQTRTELRGSGEVDGPATARFVVTLTAADRDAIHSVSLGGESTRNCGSDSIGQTTDALYADQHLTADASADPPITTLSLTLNIGVESECEVGLVWQGTSILLLGEGTNKLGASAMGVLSIKLAP